MSQNARINSRLARAPAVRTRRPQLGQIRPGGVLGRLSVPQKLTLAALLLGTPFFASAAVSVVSEMRALGTLNQHRKVQQLLVPMSSVLLDTLRLRYQGTVLIQTDLSSAERQASVDELQSRLMGSLATLSSGLGASGYGDLATQVTALKTPLTAHKQSLDDLSLRAVQVHQTYTDLLDRSVLPLFDALTAQSGLTSADTAAARNLALLATSQLPQNVSTADSATAAFYPIIASLGEKGTLITNATRTEATLRYQVALNALNRVQESLSRAAATSPQTQKVALQRAQDALKAAGQPLMEQLSGGTMTSSTLDIDRVEFMTLADAYSRALYDTQQVTLTALGQTLDAASAKRRQALILLILGLLLVVAAAVTLVALIARSITGPMRQLQLGAQQLQQGNLDTQVPVTSSDELGELTVAFNSALRELRGNQEHSRQQLLEAAQLQQNISEFLDVTMGIADGDLTRRGAVTENVLGNVVDSINLMTEELAQTLRSVQQASATVSGGSQVMLGTTAQIEDGTRATTHEAQQIARQAQDMSQGIRTMAAIARASTEASRRALVASEQGQQAVTETLQGMDAIRISSRSAQEQVQVLAQRSEEIGEIVEAVSHIASQVNLLSLHASIEAAGAGPAGVRFAVVADEVRTLADESAAATGRIGDLIGDLRREIQEVAQGIRANAAQVEAGYAVADSAGTRLREIAELAGITAQLARNISQAADRQVLGVGVMSRGTQQIAEVASASQSSAGQARAAAEQLEGLAKRLDSSLARFRLT